MPTTSPERQLLLQNLLLQSEMDIDDGINTDSDSSSVSSTSSDSSDSSTSSSESDSSSESNGPMDEDEDISDDEDELYAARLATYGEMLQVVSSMRVINPHTVAKASQLHLVLVEFKADDPKRFRRNLRVSPETFDDLVLRIEDHPIFSNNSRHPQTPTYIQLAIALFRFGHHGNAASVESIAQWAGVSAGLVVKCTRRVIIAFLSMHDSVIQWPTEDEKDEAKAWVESVSCEDWAGGFCMVDGTLIPLFEKLNVQLITLPNLRVIDYVIGHCGSAHDSTAFCDSRTYKEHCTLFKKDEEWLWADSAYGLDWWCVTPYKKPVSMQPNNKTFNYHLSRVRVKSEHAMGYIKGRFPSLRELRQQIDNAVDHERALAWVKACIVIHTLVGMIERGSEDPGFQEELVEAGLGGLPLLEPVVETEAPSSRRKSRGEKKRGDLKAKLFASGLVLDRE